MFVISGQNEQSYTIYIIVVSMKTANMKLTTDKARQILRSIIFARFQSGAITTSGSECSLAQEH